MNSSEQDDPHSPPDSAPDLSELLGEILAGIYRQEGMTAQGFAVLGERLDGLSEQLAQLTGSPQAAADEEFVAEEAPEEGDDDERSDDESVDVFPAVDDEPPAVEFPPLAQPVPRPVQPVRDVQPVAAQLAASELEAVVFRDDLAQYESLAGPRRELVEALRRGEQAATALAGQILSFRAALADQLAPQLKEVGEAWFRFRPNETGVPDPLREALIAWLHGRCDAAGLGNRIELVRVGDRYDSKRHNAKQRGVEVTGVHGWVVLRDNGNVYTKANVAVG